MPRSLANRAASFRQVLRDVYTELLQAIEHANLPLFRIVEVFRPERSDTHNALFQTIVQLLPRTEHDTARPTESDGHSGGHQLQGIDLFLNFVADLDGSFDGALGFNAAIFASCAAAFRSASSCNAFCNASPSCFSNDDARASAARTPSRASRSAASHV